MRIAVTFTPGEVESRDVSGAAVVVIDCLRASTSIVTALGSGAAAVYPFAGIEEALAEKSRRPGALLAGERGGVKIDGFDLGNSPREFRSQVVAGREIIMTTTNGTRILQAAGRAEEIFVAGFVNAGATAGALAGREGRIVLAAAGTEGRFSIEDAVCAGVLVKMLSKESRVELDDAAAFVSLAVEHPWDRLEEAALSGRGAANLRAAGLGGDLAGCLVLDAIPLVAKALKDPFRIVKV